MLVMFRCDSGSEMGTGHVMRCLTLADALDKRGVQCEFTARAHAGNLNGLIRTRGFTVHELALAAGATNASGGLDDSTAPSHHAWLGTEWHKDAEQTAQAVGGRTLDWLVVDHYALDARWEARMRSRCRRLMVIDDLVDRQHDCDLLLDQNFGRVPADYRSLVPEHCKILAGSRFVLLRPEFAAARQEGIARRSYRHPVRLLLSMGGADNANASSDVLIALKSAQLPADTSIVVVLGPNAPWLDEVREIASSMPWPTRVLAGIKDVARVMAEADLAIGSGGVGTYERLYMGLPAVVRPIAANQDAPLRAMAGAGLFELFEDSRDLVAKLERATKDGIASPPEVVADGTADICQELLRPCVALVAPGPWDVRRTFHWLQDPGLRQDFLARDVPRRAAHIEYWRRALADSDQHFFSVLHDGAHVGNAGIRNIDRTGDHAELWLYLGDAATRGKGLGKAVLAALEHYIRDIIGVGNAVLHVSRTNAAAISLYTGAGYGEVEIGRDNIGGFDPGIAQRMEKRL